MAHGERAEKMGHWDKVLTKKPFPTNKKYVSLGEMAGRYGRRHFWSRYRHYLLESLRKELAEI